MRSMHHHTLIPSHRTCRTSSTRRFSKLRLGLDLCHSHTTDYMQPSLHHLVSLALSAVALLPVPNELEPANDLANGEETNHLGSDNTGAPVLCARRATDLREEGVGVHAVHKRGGVAERVERRLEVALDGLDGTVSCERDVLGR
jgi:hypothetical protein